MRRIDKWNKAKRDACLSEFRRLVKTHRQDQVANAVAAGRSLAQLLRDNRVLLIGVDDVQLERFRRRFAVPRNLKHVMYSVATGKIIDGMFNERLNRKFREGYRTISGKLRLAERCPLCSKRTCRCELMETPKPKQRQPRKPHPAAGTVVSVRGIAVERSRS